MLLYALACAPTCGPGTTLAGRQCVGVTADSGGGDTHTDSDTDTDSDADTSAGPCAPTDAWTGPIPAALNTTVPYDASYDAGLSVLGAEVYNNPSGSNGGQSWLVSGATVSAIGLDAGGNLDTVYIEDAAYSVTVHDDRTTTPGG